MRISAAVSRGTEPAPVIEQLELEEPRAGEMRIRLVATGICHTDLHEHPGRHSPQPSGPSFSCGRSCGTFTAVRSGAIA